MLELDSPRGSLDLPAAVVFSGLSSDAHPAEGCGLRIALVVKIAMYNLRKDAGLAPLRKKNGGCGHWRAPSHDCCPQHCGIPM